MPTSFKVDGKDDDDDEDDESEESHWLIAVYPIGASCFLFQMCAMWIVQDLDCKECLNKQLKQN